MFLTLALVALGTVAACLYWLGKRRYSYWEEKGVVQPSSEFGFGQFKEAYFGRINYGTIISNIYNSYSDADAVGVYDLFKPKLLVRSNHLIQQVMTTDFSSFHDNDFQVSERLDPHFYRDPFCLTGDKWKPGRSCLIPLLTQSRMKDIYPLMKEVIKRFDEYLKQNHGKDIEAKDVSTLFTMDAISSCVFGISSNCFTDSDASFRKMADIIMKDQLQSYWTTTILLRFPTLRNLLGLRFVPLSVVNFIKEMVTHVVNHRKSHNVVRNDLIQVLVNKNADPASEETLGIAVTFFLEGFETSSMVASAALYELALNPDIQDSLYDELHNAFDDKTGIDMETLCNLPYLNKVVQEAMRKHPVLFNMQKLCTKDTSIEVNGKTISIQKGTSIIIPIHPVHFDSKYYPNPEIFDPERFTEENVSSRPPFTFLSFGEGPRFCMGYRLGLLQVKSIIGHSVLHYNVCQGKNFPPRLSWDPQVWLASPKEEMWLRLEPRT